ncbi:MAG: hypothetical protein ACYS0G_02425 [Planctomycetota bacterium]|jgi:1,2-phenylacetyl-CoA epoxidase PaaB subunit
MSKLRDNVTIVEGELQTPAEGDLKPYVIFTQLTDGGPHVYAGWLDAKDDQMALQYAREHYGQDRKCVNIWAIPKSAIAGTEPEYPVAGGNGPAQSFEVFTQRRSGDPHISAGSVERSNSEAALQAAQREDPSDPPPHSIWVVPREEIAATGKGDLIWRLTDQSYRLAHGYAADVRDKWEQIRARKDVEEYEKDDLKETF